MRYKGDSEGFATTVFPAAIAGAIFQVSRYSGRFQGEITSYTYWWSQSIV